MRFETEADIQALIDHRIPESAGLEYKRQLDFGSKKERAEALKDLTGMANGGGGTILYGVDEAEREESNVASEITPLTDEGLPSALDNLVRDGVQTPLLVEYERIGVEGGFVLAVGVRPSPLGPYMVTAYKKHSYFHRSGTSTSPMNENQVRDAYAVALRARETRAQDWADRGLPLVQAGHVRVGVTGVPVLLGRQMVDTSTVEPSDLEVVPPSILAYLGGWDVPGMKGAARSLARWSDGFHGRDWANDRGGTLIRVDRDGCVAVAFGLDSAGGPMWTHRLVRCANAGLLYLGWVWQAQEFEGDIELRIDATRLDGQAFSPSSAGSPRWEVVNPPGLTIADVSHVEIVRPATLLVAAERHKILNRFADRLYQALGQRRAEAPFRRGVLHGADEKPLDLSVGPDSIRNDRARSSWVATVHRDREITGPDGSKVLGWLIDGVVLDPSGDAVAVIEMAPGGGCPADFVGQFLADEADGVAGQVVDQPNDFYIAGAPPVPTGRWSRVDLPTLLG